MNLRIYLIAFIFFPATCVWGAPPRVNNGGGGWVCHDKDPKSVRWIQTIDLYEARAGLSTLTEPALSEDPWALYAAKLDFIKTSVPGLQAILARSPLDLHKIFHLVNSELDNFVDSSMIYRPRVEQCAGGYIEYVQIADFLIDGNLIVSNAIWSDPHFSSLEKAALLLHEHIYWALRNENGDSNSVRTRALVGALFSNKSASLISQRIDEVLKDTSNLRTPDDSVVRYPVYLKCWASVHSPQQTLEVRDWRMNYGDTHEVEIYGYTFTVHTNAEDGVPSNMTIENKKEKWKSSLRPENIRPIFTALRYAMLNLDSAEGEKLSAVLACRSLTEDEGSFVINPLRSKR
jgi:hypothetical protein